MRKLFLPALAILSMVVVTSCGASKHRCPAYGANEKNIDIDTEDMNIDTYNPAEQKG